MTEKVREERAENEKSKDKKETTVKSNNSFLFTTKPHAQGIRRERKKKKRHSGSRKRNFSQLGMFLIQSKAAALNKMLTQQIHKKKKTGNQLERLRVFACVRFKVRRKTNKKKEKEKVRVETILVK